ncbi:hypothetical protein BJ508DRAFT_329865 [Ascobolus immersus RN42]|uniref:Uncharacterized protein n=1 Tax=Ascobolus immersus RN42 TaxID=1160509 RepID=A0A3N4HZF1_ASCIM|nr:hypothetical protein BJ508DRAFT_329865 [Ascobolus immersus RN42]
MSAPSYSEASAVDVQGQIAKRRSSIQIGNTIFKEAIPERCYPLTAASPAITTPLRCHHHPLPQPSPDRTPLTLPATISPARSLSLPLAIITATTVSVVFTSQAVIIAAAATITAAATAVLFTSQGATITGTDFITSQASSSQFPEHLFS